MTWNLNEVETSNNKKNNKKEYKKVEWLKTPGSYTVTINGWTDDEHEENYHGSPFIGFNLYTEDGRKNSTRFYKPKDGEKPSTSEFKRKLLKEFLVNAGVTSFDDMDAALNDAVGKRLQCVFCTEEYVGTDRETNEPVVRTALKYKFSKKMGQTIKYDAKYNKTLSPDAHKDFQELHRIWSESQAGSSNDNGVVFESHDGEDLPF